MKVKSIKLSEIKTPKTVAEFRDNLKKYFASCGDNNLYVHTSKSSDGILIDEISSFDDIYRITDDHKPMICPLIQYDKEETFAQWEKNQSAYLEDMSNWLFFHDDYEVFVNEDHNWTKLNDIGWFTLDNKVLREFYMHVLGEYAGYGLLSDHAPLKKAV